MTKKEIGLVLKKLRTARGMTQKEVAEKLGRKQQVIGHWETGYAQPDANTLFILCDIYGVTVDDAFGFQKNNSVTKDEYDHIKKYRYLDDFGRETIDAALDRETKRVEKIRSQQDHIYQLEQRIVTEVAHRIAIPLYGKFASAGDGAYLFDDIPTDTIKVLDTPIARKADFVIGVDGDSMEPDFYDGEKVFVEKTADLEVGDIGIFLKGSDCYIKELGADRLISHNKAYEDIAADEEIRTIGKVTGKVEEI